MIECVFVTDVTRCVYVLRSRKSLTAAMLCSKAGRYVVWNSGSLRTCYQHGKIARKSHGRAEHIILGKGH